MDVEHRLAQIASAIAEPARTRMLCCLMDRRARTATELCAVAGMAASTTSAHLSKLVEQGLIACVPQGRHRYYTLASDEAAAALEALMVVAGRTEPWRSRTPQRLQQARTCYDHLAGTLAVRLHDRLLDQGWLLPQGDRDYALAAEGEKALAGWGVDLAWLPSRRRRFACACLDWSERRSHLGGALGAAILDAAVRWRWLEQDLEGRGVRLTQRGRREWLAPLDLDRDQDLAPQEAQEAAA